jgi:hypothetical protein
MTTLAELQTRLFATLSKYSHISDFFGEMLTERVGRADWLDNALAQVLLHEAESNLQLLSQFVVAVGNYDNSLLNDLRSQLTGKEKDFDNQLNDLLAELNATRWLIEKGYTNVAKIPRAPQKTPDLQAQLNNSSYAIEVKNIRAPNSLVDHLMMKLESQNLKYPDIYTNVFVVDLPLDDDSSDPLDDTDQLNVMKFLNGLHDAVVSEKTDFSWTYSKSSRGRNIQRTIKCKWGTGSQFLVMAHSASFFFRFDDATRQSRLIVPLIRKTWQKVESALDQLSVYDSDDTREKVVLLNWQRTPSFKFDDHMAEKYQIAIGHIDNTVKSLNRKCSVMLL